MQRTKANYIEYEIIDILDKRYIFIPETLFFFNSEPEIEKILLDFNMINDELFAKSYPLEVTEELLAIKEEIDLYAQKPHPQKRKMTIRSVELNVAQLCNLKCAYCFALDGTHGTAKMMTIEIAKEIIDYLYNSQLLGDELMIIFIGGEPLLNMNVVSFIMEYSTRKAADNEKIVRFSMTTNGTRLDLPTMEELEKYNVKIMLSLDSHIPEIHNRLRPLTSGKGSYATIASNGVKSLQTSRRNRFVQMTITPQNLHINDTVRAFVEQGFTHINLEKVKSTIKQFTFTKEDNEKIADQLAELAEYQLSKIEQNENVVIHPLLSFLDMLHLHNRIPRLNRCSMLYNSMCISADGTFYPCDGIMYDQYKIGSIHDHLNYDQIFQFRTSLLDHSKCSNCWARNLCNKGCILETQANDLPTKYDDCDLKLEICKLQLYIYDAINQINPDYLDRYNFEYKGKYNDSITSSAPDQEV